MSQESSKERSYNRETPWQIVEVKRTQGDVKISLSAA